MPHTLRGLAATLFALLAIWLWTAPRAQAAGTIDGSNCNATAVSNAISGGGVTDFTADCTVTLNATIAISSDTTINGNGHDVVLSGGDAVRVLHVSGGNVEINGITIANGYTYQSTETGGAGLAHSGGTVTINDSTFRDNVAGSWDSGGAILHYGVAGTLTINRSVFYNNSGDYAGAIASSETLVVDNSTISGNTANAVFGYGTGGIYSTGEATISNSTITGNSGVTDAGGFGGGGITADGTSFTIQNTIVSGNTTTGSTDHDCNSISVTIASLGYNLVGQNGSDNGCPSNGTGDVILSGAASTALNTTLLNNGGPTLTHALVDGSPAVDAFPPGTSGCVAGESIDQRGAVRADGTNRGERGCDIGAYEHGSGETPAAVTMAQVDVRTAHSGGGLLLLALALSGLASASLAALRRRR